MRKMDQYLSTMDTMYPDGHAREGLFRDSGDMLQPSRPHKGGVLGRLIAGMSQWQMKRSGRLALRDLDDGQLRDIGITREQAVLEARKSFFPFK